MDVFDATPKVAKCIVATIRTGELSYLCQSWVTTESKYLSVVANVDFAVVEASFEQEGVPFVTPLAFVARSAEFREDLVSKSLASSTRINNLDSISVPMRRVTFESLRSTKNKCCDVF